MTFKGVRDNTRYIRRYQNIIGYLIDIQDNYPSIYRMLDQAPQFEHEADLCRKRLQWAGHFLSILEGTVRARILFTADETTRPKW